jgi:ketosteroid isomerase-like protein
MFRMNTLGAALAPAVLAIAFVVCATPPAIAQGRGPSQPQIEAASKAFVAAFNKKDAAGVAALYTADAVLMPPNVPLLKGRADIQKFYQGQFDKGIADLKLNPLQSVVSGQTAFEAGTSDVETGKGGSDLLLLGVGGPRSIRSSGKYVVIYRRDGGSWKISYDIFNDDAAQASK